jgi:putative addiction module CopG family antidote
MNIVLPEALEEYVNDLVKTGDYSGLEEIVAEALREHQAHRQGIQLQMTPELEHLLDEGLKNLDQARSTDELRKLR